MRKLFVLVVLYMGFSALRAQQKTYCNPWNVDYGYTPVLDHMEWENYHRAAHPVIVNYKGYYYLFATSQGGYWWSSDLANWQFIGRNFLPPESLENILEGWKNNYAPAVWVQDGALYVMGVTNASPLSIWASTNPKENVWSKATDSFAFDAHDPTFFSDDDNHLYMYTCDNSQAIYGVELHPKTFQPIGTRKEVLRANNIAAHFAVKGVWMTKHQGNYYLQWSDSDAASTLYSSSVAVGKHPLGPFEQNFPPFDIKTGGFIHGTGNGAMFRDYWENYWYVSAVAANMKDNPEYHVGVWPAGFDEDGVMYCHTAFGDYPHYLPDGEANHRESRFTGWMLLNYNKPLKISSSIDGHSGHHLIDEDIKTYWSAVTGDVGEWFISDLGNLSTVHAIQINFATQHALHKTRAANNYQKYKLSYSVDGKKWRLLIDKVAFKKNIPYDYLELEEPVKARYLKVEPLYTDTGNFAVSGFRVFGLGDGDKPESVSQLTASRPEAAGRRRVALRWQQVNDAYAYNIYIGEHPDKLYSCVMVYDAVEYYYRNLNPAKSYYFAIEAINENGISDRTHTEVL